MHLEHPKSSRRPLISASSIGHISRLVQSHIERHAHRNQALRAMRQGIFASRVFLQVIAGRLFWIGQINRVSSHHIRESGVGQVYVFPCPISGTGCRRIRVQAPTDD